jgi:hypothetical protein
LIRDDNRGYSGSAPVAAGGATGRSRFIVERSLEVWVQPLQLVRSVAEIVDDAHNHFLALGIANLRGRDLGYERWARILSI